MSDMAHDEPGKALFDALIQLIQQQQTLMAQIAAKVSQIPPGGGGGGGGTGNGFELYEPNKIYRKYQAIIDPVTSTAYTVTPVYGDQYVSTNIAQDCANGNLKLLGFDSQIVVFDHPPTQAEINSLPENALVVEFDPDDVPYSGILSDSING